MARKWTAEERQRQAEIIREAKPWKKSTGPKTAAGKNKVAQNAYKHGLRSRDYDEICRLLRENNKKITHFLSALKLENGN